MSSNSAENTHVFPRLFVLYCSVLVEALRSADRSYKESYQMSKKLKKLPMC
jgi:hypothetical protein